MTTNVKITLEKGETIEQAEEKLYKALDSHRNGDLHTEDFTDPAMKDLIDKMLRMHDQTYQELLQEIFDELDKEYSNDNF